MNSLKKEKKRPKKPSQKRSACTYSAASALPWKPPGSSPYPHPPPFIFFLGGGDVRKGRGDAQVAHPLTHPPLPLRPPPWRLRGFGGGERPELLSSLCGQKATAERRKIWAPQWVCYKHPWRVNTRGCCSSRACSVAAPREAQREVSGLKYKLLFSCQCFPLPF